MHKLQNINDKLQEVIMEERTHCQHLVGLNDRLEVRINCFEINNLVWRKLCCCILIFFLRIIMCIMRTYGCYNSVAIEGLRYHHHANMLVISRHTNILFIFSNIFFCLFYDIFVSYVYSRRFTYIYIN